MDGWLSEEKRTIEDATRRDFFHEDLLPTRDRPRTISRGKIPDRGPTGAGGRRSAPSVIHRDVDAGHPEKPAKPLRCALPHYQYVLRIFSCTLFLPGVLRNVHGEWKSVTIYDAREAARMVKTPADATVLLAAK